MERFWPCRCGWQTAGSAPIEKSFRNVAIRRDGYMMVSFSRSKRRFVMMTIKRADQVGARRRGGVMRKGHITVRRIAVVLFTVCLVACGGSSPRHLLSISITPPTANGANFPLGGVQFIAAGTFDKAPATVTPLTATWSISPSGVASIETSAGFAQCISTGIATITASAPITQGSSTMVSGTATLTC